MASALNKRQQARNERALQELIKTVPGNGTCADCGARNPGWASWSLGIFLCMRCAALHRKLGTHISKVKSLSMDKWDNAQVDNMKRIGNIESNRQYNPRNIKAQIPIDVDEVDSALERYIRQKYEQRIFMHDSRPGTRQNTGSTSSAEDRPPPLPPKPTKRFGFGLQKSSTSSRNVTPPISPSLGGFPSHDVSPPRINKPSRVFGSNISTSGDGLESKLATLRDMGFPDDKRNSTVLRGLNGNLDRTVEALIRLGEQAPGKSRGNTPTPPAKPGVNGISIDTTRTTPAAVSSMNPFDALDAVAPLPQHQPQTASIQNQYGNLSAPQLSPTNPFGQYVSQGQYSQPAYPQQQQQQNPFGYQQQNLEQSFQGLHLSNQQQQQQQQQSQQPLFPNRTGGYGQIQNSQFAQSNPFQQSFTPPPVPQVGQQYGSFVPPQPQYQSMSSPSSPGNPFLKSSRSQMFTPTNTLNSNPFGLVEPQQQQQQQPQLQLQTPNPFFAQQQQQQQQQQQVQSASAAQAPNPWSTGQQNYQQQNFQPQSYQQPNYQQQGNPFNKNSILALYNYPQLAPQRPEQSQTPPTPAPASAPAVPGPGHMNPFASQPSQQALPQSAVSAVQSQPRHVSNESVDFAGLMGGRHSPDAFTGLSASFRR